MSLCMSGLNDQDERTLEKVLSLNTLPSFREVQNVLKAWEGFTGKWHTFCLDNGVYLVPCREFVTALAHELHRFDGKTIVEICAGSGKLSYHLQKEGIPIAATDPYSSHSTKPSPHVERIDHHEALATYKPHVIVMAWAPDHGRVGAAILAYPSVHYVIDIGEGIGACTWLTHELLGSNWGMRHLDRPERYVLGATDSYEYGLSRVRLLSRLKLSLP